MSQPIKQKKIVRNLCKKVNIFIKDIFLHQHSDFDQELVQNLCIFM